ncbi:MAG: hypothetical protein HN623_08440 [Bdellovibrionales bacterium]|nr:hypothetical protein [Bdellovibrionales bacterium]
MKSASPKKSNLNNYGILWILLMVTMISMMFNLMINGHHISKIKKYVGSYYENPQARFNVESANVKESLGDLKDAIIKSNVKQISGELSSLKGPISRISPDITKVKFHIIEIDHLIKTIKSPATDIHLLKDRRKFFNSYNQTARSILSFLKGEEIAVRERTNKFPSDSLNFLLMLLFNLGTAILLVMTIRNRKGISQIRTEWEREKQLGTEVEDEHVLSTIIEACQPVFPFHAIMLDQTNTICWANNSFLKEWNIRTLTAPAISWNDFQKYTRIHRNHSKVRLTQRGFYRIEMKAVDSEVYSPYQLYVSPMNQRGVKRTLVMFSPTGSVEENLQAARPLLRPIATAIEAMNNNNFTSNLRGILRKDMQCNGISNIYEDIAKYFETVSGQRMGLLNEIEHLEERISILVGDREEQGRKVTDIDKSVSTLQQSFTDLSNLLIGIKENVLIQTVSRQELEGEISKYSDQVNLFQESYQNLLTGNEALSRDLANNLDEVGTLVPIKATMENLMQKIDRLYTTTRGQLDQVSISLETNDITTAKECTSEAMDQIRYLEKVSSLAHMAINHIEMFFSTVTLSNEDEYLSRYRTKMSDFVDYADQVQEKISYNYGETTDTFSRIIEQIEAADQSMDQLSLNLELSSQNLDYLTKKYVGQQTVNHSDQQSGDSAQEHIPTPPSISERAPMLDV